MREYETDSYLREFYHWVDVPTNQGGRSATSATVVEEDGEIHYTRFFYMPPVSECDYCED